MQPLGSYEGIISEIFQLTGSARRTYQRGAELVEADVVPNTVFFLRRGLLKLVHLGESGREHILALLPAPCLAGIAPVVGERPIGGSVIAATTCEVEETQADRFRALARSRPDVLWVLYQLSSSDLCAMHLRAAEMLALPPRRRLARAFRAFAPSSRNGSSGVRLSIPITHRELAQFIGVTPEHLSRLLHQLESEAAIARQRGWIIVRDRRLLNDGDDYEPETRRPHILPHAAGALSLESQAVLPSSTV